MTYTLFIWTIVAMAGDRFHQEKAYDWRPIAEFHSFAGNDALEKCEQGARQLALKPEKYRCVRTK